MKFELKDEYLQKGETRKPSFVILPSGICEVLINTAGAPVTKNCICNFTKETKINCVLIDVGFIGIYVCGDILITLKEMGYDLASKDDWKRAKKQDREKIVAEYEKLVSEKPELFDASKVDTSQLSQVIEKSGAEVATASEEKDTNTDASPEKVDKDKNITVKDLKFPLLESYFTYKTIMGDAHVKKIILPSGKYETESIFNGITYFESSVFSCDITGISASKNNNLFRFSVSTFRDVRVCGDILITLIEMDKYDFRNKKETKKIKGDKDYILENYFRLLEEKPELFDEKRIKDTQLNSKKTVTKTKPSKKVNKQKTKRKSPSTRGSTKKLDEKLKTDEPIMSYIEELKELGKLRDDGVLNEVRLILVLNKEGFQQKKEKLFSITFPSDNDKSPGWTKLNKKELQTSYIEQLNQLFDLKKQKIIIKDEYDYLKSVILSPKYIKSYPFYDKSSNAFTKRMKDKKNEIQQRLDKIEPTNKYKLEDKGIFQEILNNVFTKRITKVGSLLTMGQEGDKMIQSEINELNSMLRKKIIKKNEYEGLEEFLLSKLTSLGKANYKSAKASKKLGKSLDKLGKIQAKRLKREAKEQKEEVAQRKERETIKTKEKYKKYKEEKLKRKEKLIRLKNLKPSIIKLLKKQGTKIPASDIDAHLKYKNVDEVKKTCEEMYHDGRIGRTGNYRYFVLTKK